MEAFRQALDDSGLTDLGFQGPKFTWANLREGGAFIKERLDRGVANQSWHDLYPVATTFVDAAIASDHSPLTL